MNLIRNILIVILAVGVIGVGYWGYTEHQQKTAVLMQAENNYQRAFHDLTYEMDLLNNKIGNTLAMSSKESLSPALAEVWRLTSEAQENVGQLPLALLPFNKTEDFLANVGNFSYRAAVRDLSKEPLSNDEYKTLKSLYKTSTDIQNELRHVQKLVLSENLRWMDVELALATNEKTEDNTIVDGLKTVEKSMEGYDESDFGPSFVTVSQQNQDFSQLKGKKISKEQAKQVARSFLTLKGNEKITVTESGKESKYDAYSLTIKDPDTKNEIYMDVTKKGGYPIWILSTEDSKKTNISLNQAMEKSNKFLKKQRFVSLVMAESTQYDNTGVFTYVEEQDGVWIYPDAVKMKVSLENGNIVGFSAKEFLLTHRLRKIPKPELTKQEAVKKINENVKIMEDRLAIINNDLNEEVLCYEFLGTINDDTYRIFVNAKTGREEKVDKLKNPEALYDRS